MADKIYTNLTDEQLDKLCDLIAEDDVEIMLDEKKQIEVDQELATVNCHVYVKVNKKKLDDWMNKVRKENNI